MRDEARQRVIDSAWWTLRIGFGLGPFLAGLDKFFDLLVFWPRYIAPPFARLLPIGPQAFMHVVGVIVDGRRPGRAAVAVDQAVRLRRGGVAGLHRGRPGRGALLRHRGARPGHGGFGGDAGAPLAARAAGADTDLRSRHGRALTRYFPEVVDALRRLPQAVVLDGELVAAAGPQIGFTALMNRLHPSASRVDRLRRQTPACFVAFDLLALDGRDLRARPFAERRDALERLLDGASTASWSSPWRCRTCRASAP